MWFFEPYEGNKYFPGLRVHTWKDMFTTPSLIQNLHVAWKRVEGLEMGFGGTQNVST